MRAYFLIFALALLEVSLAYPQIYNNDFSIDMYEGANHLRYERSNENEAASQGTEVVVQKFGDAENVDAEHALEFHKTDEKAMTIEETIKLAQAAMDSSAAKASEGQKTEVDPANVHLHQADTTIKTDATKTETAAAAATKTETVIDSAVKKVETADKVVKDETHKATAAETKTTAEATTKKDETPTGGISHSISKVEISTSRSSNKQKEEVKELSQATKPSYLFKYGEVLNLINQDKINPLSSKKSKKEKSKKLTKTNNNGGTSTGFSYVMVNGKEYAGPTSGGAITIPKSNVNQQQQNNQQNNFGAPTNGFMGVPTPYGHQQFGGAAPAAFKPGFNPMREGTQSLRSNIRMGGFPGVYQGFAQPPPTANGIRMLGFNRPPVPFKPAGFRPF